MGTLNRMSCGLAVGARLRVARVAALFAIPMAAVTALAMLCAPFATAATGTNTTGTNATSANATAAQVAGNPSLVATIAAHLAELKGVRAQFKQTQTLAAMREPLVSTGSLLFYRDRGVVWEIDTPYRTTYVIGDAGVNEVNANGQREKGASAGHSGGAQGVAQVSRMMRAMLGGDLSALYTQFNVDARGTTAHWQMQLTPNQPQLAQSIRSLQMSGGAYLQTLRITLASGDVTQIDFTGSTAVNALTPAERALFGAS
ncbi:outer membrane lipoprotein carrier protein LolA [Paraburkholderia rhizosphaerae]|uniref:Outer membrane lipoprotein-sorting protein n=1 Tax=Paraburkholderia rhizosphaerae TaxID=480658 RepID=A0A4R8LM62_9BURK|nr:outer membrane lipoprotein carrier protein LolA [Paraburkholderia rhizosphaerae]TDY46436.1 outer membrane lipoprotein-sorting protein [Paraburkholderia rhizosphaerae]